ncbi:MAG: hypothetical protein ACK4MV_17725 [Beijerinckiaceae bacterium]
MLVFGDLATQENARATLAKSLSAFQSAMARHAGLSRHAGLVNAYVETARVAQGCVDAEFARMGEDAITPLHAAAIAALRAMARVLEASWRSAFRETGALDAAALAGLGDCASDAVVHARVAEGFAFYALYPEACFDDAMREEDSPVVVGVRSIGMALAPLLAQSLKASLCLTVRPVGSPFARECRLAPDLREALHARRDARFCVIDEGPGLSGSSLMAVSSALQEVGVERERITVVASNASGPGGAAAEATRDWWRASRFRILDAAPAITRALAPCSIIRDMGGGRWRESQANAAAPANRPYERLKYLVEDRDGLWLAKFSGLGALGRQKAQIARTLADGGFAPVCREERHGFVLHRWLADARPITCASRKDVVTRLAGYVAFRARRLPALATGGASMDDLFVMAKHNLANGASAAAAALLDRFSANLGALAALERPIASDNRMHAWEWIVDPRGAILKCDGEDHCAGHDLVGCRDAAWDVAGAIIEFDIAGDEREDLIAQFATHGVAISPKLLDFFLVAYCAFQTGCAHMAAQANAQWPDEAKRWRDQAKRYLGMLEVMDPDPARSR